MLPPKPLRPKKTPKKRKLDQIVQLAVSSLTAGHINDSPKKDSSPRPNFNNGGDHKPINIPKIIPLITKSTIDKSQTFKSAASSVLPQRNKFDIVEEKPLNNIEIKHNLI